MPSPNLGRIVPRNKLQILADETGEEINDMLEAASYDGMAQGICANFNCTYTTNVEPDCDDGHCEICKTNTVRSCLSFAGLI